MSLLKQTFSGGESVSSVSNENRRDDVVRKVKDEYYTKEAEDTRKHKAELRHLTEQYQKEIEDLKAEHAEKVKQLEGYMRTRLSKQDQEQQRQVQEMRDLYTQQLRKKLEESQMMRNEQKEAYEFQMNKQKNVFDNQKSRLENQFNNELKSKDEAFQKYALYAREQGDKTWSERREKIQKSTDEQLQRERENHDNQLSNMSRQLTEMKKSKKLEVDQLKQQNEFEKNRLELVNRQAKENQENMNASVHESMNLEHQSQQKLMKSKFREEVDKKIADLEASQQDFRETTSERINRHLNALKADLKNEKNERIVEKNSLEQLAALEKKHIQDDYEKRLEDERQQKKLALDSVTNEVSSEVNKAVKGRDQLLKDLSDSHLRERELKRSQTTAQIAQMKNDMQAIEDHVTQRADSKVNRANELVRQNGEKLQRYYDESLEIIKRDFMKELNNERIRHTEERAELEGRLEKKVRDREKSVSQDLEKKVTMYEDMLEAQKEAYSEEMRRKDEMNKEQLQARERNFRDAMKSQEMKYQNQIQQIKDTAANDMDSLERRHRDEMSHLAQKISDRQKRS